MQTLISVLVVNNYSLQGSSSFTGKTRLQRFSEVLNRSHHVKDFSIIHYSELSKTIDDYNAIILTGSALNVSQLHQKETITAKVTHNGELLQDEMNLILNTKKPLLAICFGMQLASYCFDPKSVYRLETLGHLDREVYRVRSLELETESLFSPQQLCIELNHQDMVYPTDTLKEHFDIFSVRKTEKYQWIYYMMHKNRLLLATQFHPEGNTATRYKNEYHFDEGTSIEQCLSDGAQLIHKFLEYAATR